MKAEPEEMVLRELNTRIPAPRWSAVLFRKNGGELNQHGAKATNDIVW